MMARIMGAVGRAEVEQKSARQKLANRQRAKNGSAWVQRTFGYDGDEIVAHEADAIRKACQALLNGARCTALPRNGIRPGCAPPRATPGPAAPCARC